MLNDFLGYGPGRLIIFLIVSWFELREKGGEGAKSRELIKHSVVEGSQWSFGLPLGLPRFSDVILYTCMYIPCNSLTTGVV